MCHYWSSIFQHFWEMYLVFWMVYLIFLGNVFDIFGKCIWYFWEIYLVFWMEYLKPAALLSVHELECMGDLVGWPASCLSSSLQLTTLAPVSKTPDALNLPRRSHDCQCHGANTTYIFFSKIGHTTFDQLLINHIKYSSLYLHFPINSQKLGTDWPVTSTCEVEEENQWPVIGETFYPGLQIQIQTQIQTLSGRRESMTGNRRNLCHSCFAVKCEQ